MKKVILLLLVLTMLLCACGKGEKQEVSTTTQTQSQTQPSTETPPEEPEPEVPKVPYEEFYVADSAVEIATNGAVKEYNMGDCYAAMMFGEGILLLSGDEDTVMTYVKPDGIWAEKTVEEQCLFPVELTILPENRLAYYDIGRQAVIVLDEALKELNEIPMPDTIEGIPAVTADGSRIYYLTNEELRYIDLESGLDKMLKEMSFPVQMIEKLHFDDSILECYIVDDDEYVQYLMISTKTGQMVHAAEDMPVLSTWGDNYFATVYEGGVAQCLFGTREGTPSCLIPLGDVYLEAVEMQGVVSCEESEGTIGLNYYDLVSGARTNAVELPLECPPYCVIADADSGEIWFVTLNEDLEARIYCWDLALSETGDTTSCVTPYYTADEPDMEGLEQIAEDAKELGQRFGVRIRVYEEALSVQPSDYVFESEYLVPVYQNYLKELENALSKYPEGFLKKVGTTSDNGKITISLVRSAYGNNELGSLDTADGVHFYNDGNVYIGLVMGERFAPTLYHELFHSIDTYVLNECTVYDDWEKLNPKGFKYDNDYVANQLREDYQYLEEDRWFIDMYSMSYPKEDRARIMEYAMESGNEEYFESKNMQKKLSTLCKGIRTAFGLKKYSGILPWEQYLG